MSHIFIIFDLTPDSIHLPYATSTLLNSMTDEHGEPCVSYVAVTMDSSLNLTIHTKRGRPTNTEKLKTDKQTKADLRKLRKEMNYKDGTEILLALSVATDEMARHVQMFPEVFYLDVTANTNKQKRDLFLMVVKDADGSTYIGNATVIPSGKRWVYGMIYRNVFHNLYGEVTISRNKLCLTDDDTAEWGPLEDCIKTVSCWKGSLHMLCMFHALTLVYYEQIYPKLPKYKGNVTQKGKAYGETKSIYSCTFLHI